MSVFFDPPFSGVSLNIIINKLNISRAEFARMCGKNDRAWASKQCARKEVTLTFANIARASLGFARTRYHKLNQNFVINDEYQIRAKALLLDQLMAEFDEVVKVSGHAPNLKHLQQYALENKE